MPTHKSIPPEAAKLLRRIKRKIEAEPRQFLMKEWFTTKRGIPNCGTAACIRGWGIALEQGKNPRAVDAATWPQPCALNLLSLPAKDRLFYTCYWPTGPMDAIAFDKLPPKRRADLACKRIDHFLRTGE